MEQTVLVEERLEAFGHDEGRGVGFDDGRPGDAIARVECFHQVELRVDPALFAVEATRSQEGTVIRCLAAERFLGDAGFGRRHAAAHDRAGDRVAQFR